MYRNSYGAPAEDIKHNQVKCKQHACFLVPVDSRGLESQIGFSRSKLTSASHSSKQKPPSVLSSYPVYSAPARGTDAGFKQPRASEQLLALLSLPTWQEKAGVTLWYCLVRMWCIPRVHGLGMCPSAWQCLGCRTFKKWSLVEIHGQH